jgi:hypothetical protein
MNKNNGISYKLLVSLDACGEGKNFFAELFSHTVEINHKNLLMVYDADGQVFLQWLVDIMVSNQSISENDPELKAWYDNLEDNVEGEINTFMALWDKYGEEFVGDNT